MNEVALLNPQSLMDTFNETDLVSLKIQREIIPKQWEVSTSLDKGGVTVTCRKTTTIRESIAFERKK